MSERQRGVVKSFDDAKGVGFIVRDNGPDVVVHARDIVGAGHRSLQAGQQVTFKLVQGAQGMQAEDVTPA